MTEFNFGKIRITIDGVGKVNDRIRVHKDGGGWTDCACNIDEDCQYY